MKIKKETEEEKKVTQAKPEKQAWIWTVNNSIFLALVYEDGSYVLCPDA